ncbi:MAG: hypothetical protein BA861_07905 [Desulfobacterales bacterium S3730MH5]|nr:MAG: hypothetical protein BA861_07905 [Desulfobacterales bacterium S3730MH5]
MVLLFISKPACQKKGYEELKKNPLFLPLRILPITAVRIAPFREDPGMAGLNWWPFLKTFELKKGSIPLPISP